MGQLCHDKSKPELGTNYVVYLDHCLLNRNKCVFSDSCYLFDEFVCRARDHRKCLSQSP